jgi:alpha-galactosidase
MNDTMCGFLKSAALNLGRRAGPALLLLISIQAADSQITYSAASAALSNGASSAGEWVENIGGPQNGTVTFSHVKIQRDGLYSLTARFNVGDDRAFTITINDEACFDVIFHPVARGSGESSQMVLVPLHAGDNSIAFNNAHEFGPNLGDITVGSAPVESRSLSGSVRNADGAPLAGVVVLLSSGQSIRMKTVTDRNGRYEFPFLPKADYYVRPSAPADSDAFFSPYEQYFPASAPSRPEGGIDFLAKPWNRSSKNFSVMRLGNLRIEYDLLHGVADIFSGGQLLIARAFAEARLPEAVTSMDYQTRKITHRRIRDRFGRGEEFVVVSSNGKADQMVQTFRLYKNADYFLTGMKIVRKGGAASNFMAPLVSDCAGHFLAAGDNRALFVPFDNDKWVRYDAVPFGGELTSYEVSALYNNRDRHGLVIGSITHDTWKTGVESATTSNVVTRLEIFGGITSSQTRDILPHGKVGGRIIRSP